MATRSWVGLKNCLMVIVIKPNCKMGNETYLWTLFMATYIQWILLPMVEAQKVRGKVGRIIRPGAPNSADAPLLLGHLYMRQRSVEALVGTKASNIVCVFTVRAPWQSVVCCPVGSMCVQKGQISRATSNWNKPKARVSDPPSPTYATSEMFNSAVSLQCRREFCNLLNVLHCRACRQQALRIDMQQISRNCKALRKDCHHWLHGMFLCAVWAKASSAGRFSQLVVYSYHTAKSAAQPLKSFTSHMYHWH